MTKTIWPNGYLQKFPTNKQGGEPAIDCINSSAKWSVRIRHSALVYSLDMQAGDPEYAWVNRHTWQSWRERYKKNSTRLDTLVAAIVEEKKPAHGEKGQYGYVRQAEEKPKRPRGRKRTGRNEPNDEYVEHEMVPMPIVYAIPMDSHYGSGPQHPQHQFIHESVPPGMPLQMPASPQPGTQMHAPGGGPLDNVVRNSPAEEEMDDADEDPDFAVRVGNAPPPIWGKRKASDELKVEGATKRLRSECDSFHRPFDIG